MDIMGFFTSFLGGGIGALIASVVLRDWIAVKIKSVIEKKQLVQQAAFELKRSACLDALAVVDASFSQREWKHQSEKALEVTKQTLNVESARAAFNHLALTCSDPSVIDLYVKALGLRSPDMSVQKTSGDTIVDLRNAMRKELGFGKKLELDRQLAWIATLDGGT